LTGQPATPTDLTTPQYWVDQLRNTVHFHHGTTALLQQGVDTVVELSPTATLLPVVAETAGDRAPLLVPAGRPDLPERQAETLALATAHVHGALAIDWPLLYGDRRPVDIPTYAFQRRRVWLTPDQANGGPDRSEESQFWEALERGDVEALAALLDVDEDVPALAGALPVLARWRARQRLTFAPRWQPVAAAAPAAGRWLLVAPGGARDLASALAARGAEVTVVPGAAEIPVDGPEPDGVVVVPPPDGVALIEEVSRALEKAAVRAPAWLVTHGALAVTDADPAPDAAQARLWDAVLAAEHPYRLADLPADGDPQAAARLADGLGVHAPAASAGPAGGRLAARAHGLYERRLDRLTPLRRGTRAPATAWLSGGTPQETDEVARWLVRGGVRHLLLSGEPRDVGGPAGLGASLRFVAESPADLAADVPELPLAVVRFGGAEGAAAADGLTAGLDVASFLVFAADGDTAEARAEAVVRHRRARGEAATLVRWGPWPAGGTTSPADALRALRPVLDRDEPVIVISERNPDQEASEPDAAAGPGDLRARLAAAGPEGREALLTAELCAHLAAVLGHTGGEPVDAEQDLMDLGLTSLTALQLINLLQETADLELTPAALYDNPTPAALARHLADLTVEGTP
ncbi:phosphopantetheine-binding protein, partial [Streptomyces sp. WI04-05A]|uniref:phosphopantetheine-binding protein n=2 Tax=Streptomyces TaxID=1883 RepID=UPI0029AEB15D